jgi:hypothetical protein
MHYVDTALLASGDGSGEIDGIVKQWDYRLVSGHSHALCTGGREEEGHIRPNMHSTAVCNPVHLQRVSCGKLHEGTGDVEASGGEQCSATPGKAGLLRGTKARTKAHRKLYVLPNEEADCQECQPFISCWLLKTDRLSSRCTFLRRPHCPSIPAIWRPFPTSPPLPDLHSPPRPPIICPFVGLTCRVGEA